MRNRHHMRFLSSAMVLTALSATLVAAETIKLRRGLVVPVQFREELSLRQNRVGDRFEVMVQDERDLPRGTTLLGAILEIRPATSERAGYMDLEFDGLVLPDGTRHRITAVPIRMDDSAIRRGGDDRFTAKKKLDDSKKHVVNGMIGGFILGKILGRKEKEGVFLGALAGIIMFEAERNGSSANEVVIRRDMEMGALFERDAQFEWDSRSERRGFAAPAFEYEGRALKFVGEAQPFEAGQTWMVPLESVAAQVGMTVETVNSRRIFVEDDESVLILEHESRNYRLNGKKGELSRNTETRNGVVFVPIDALFLAKSGRWSINGTPIEK